jgi:uncharacterized membrane protein
MSGTASEPHAPHIDLQAAKEQHQTAQRRSGGAARWIPVVAGGALAVFGLKRGSAPGLLMLVAGGGLAYAGATGRLPVPSGAAGGAGNVRVEHAVTVNLPADELYRYWRNFENLPHVMSHLVSVTDIGHGRSHWVAKAPMGKTAEWDAQLLNDDPGRIIAWASDTDDQFQNTGAVRFEQAADGRGTVVRIKLEYAPPGGIAGATVAKLFGESPDQQIREDLRRFKQVMETGETPTTTGQPRGGHPQSRLDPLAERAKHIVQPIQDAMTGDTSPG